MKEVLFIQKAKRAELIAWENLDKSTLDSALGLFEIPKPPDDWTAGKVPHGAEPIAFKVSEIVSNIVNVFGNSRYIFDLSDWAPDATVNHGTHVIEHAFQCAINAGGAPEICANFGSCVVDEYKDALSGLSKHVTVLRLDPSAIEDSKDVEHFVSEIEDILLYLDIQAAQLTILVDFGDVSKFSELEMLNDCKRIKTALTPFGFPEFSIAGSSVPIFISDVVDTHYSDGKITRKEFAVWKKLVSQVGGESWNPVNYGVKSAAHLRDFPNRNANGKSKRTTAGGFKVFRGISKAKESLLVQHPKIAASVVAAGGLGVPRTCWGDNMVSVIASGGYSGGGHEQWISYDLNQHITFVVNEVAEFRTRIAAQSITHSETK